MIQFENFFNNENLVNTEQKGRFVIYEHKADLCADPSTASAANSMFRLGFKKRQLLSCLSGDSIRLSAGAMQWVSGDITSETGLGKGIGAIGALAKGAVKGLISGNTATRPFYSGTGFVMSEPTYRFLMLENPADWGPSGFVLSSGSFLACDASLEEEEKYHKSLAAIASLDIFHLSYRGNGVVAIQCDVARENLYTVNIEDDTFRVDGYLPVIWSGSLEYNVERTSKSFMGSLVNQEGWAQVFRGTGKVVMAPITNSFLSELLAAAKK